jgi:NLI interacting factor-like phosphatase
VGYTETPPLRIFIDLDEVLAYSSRTKAREALRTLPRVKMFEYRRPVPAFRTAQPSQEWAAFKRPFADELIHACQALAPTAILTFGERDFQRRILSELQFPSVQLFGAEDYKSLPQAKTAILIDDNEQQSGGVQSKIQGICPSLFWERPDRNLCKDDTSRFCLLRVKPWGPLGWTNPTLNTGDNILIEVIATLQDLVARTRAGQSIAHQNVGFARPTR